MAKSKRRRRMLRRYTSLPCLLDLLTSRKLTLLPPSSWDDKNDAFYLEQYKSKKNLKAVYALCFTESNETYHHWRVFSRDNVGVCVTFVHSELMSYLDAIPEITCRDVDYYRTDELEAHPPRIEDLPFVKRQAFKDEREHRVLYSDDRDISLSKSIGIGLECIYKVTVNPWLPAGLFPSIKATIRTIDHCSSLKVYRSTLLETDRWKNVALRA